MLDLIQQLLFGVLRNVGLINNWRTLEKAREEAEADNQSSQRYLGASYEQGRDVPRDYVQAYKWRKLAATTSSRPDFGEKDQVFRGTNCSMSASALKRLVLKMTPEQIVEAEKLVAEWQPAFDYRRRIAQQRDGQ